MDILQLNNTLGDAQQKSAPTLTWVNVAIGMVFILVNGEYNTFLYQSSPLKLHI
jgi:hypothetical protein